MYLSLYVTIIFKLFFKAHTIVEIKNASKQVA